MSMAATVQEAVRAVARQLAAAGVETSGLDARLIVMSAAGMTHEDLLREPGRILTADEAGTVSRHAARRAAREPLARIFGHWTFCGLDFRLSAETLVPRPETEMVVERGIGLLAGVETPRIADAGTGSGCILLSLLHALPAASGVGTDRSAGAIETAGGNAEALGLAGRAQFAVANWLDGVAGAFDLVVSNPPYIESGDIAGLEPEVRLHDPLAALDGGGDGFDAYRALIPQATARLKSGGWLVLETGSGQHKMVTYLLQNAGLANIGDDYDIAGHERVIRAQKA
ncbi:MAG: peptide chain release factor N(5)-glutamine methyltransferase [Rhodobiaceae bacterium]|nr:peptide chain release factor N(5)-glutamine methyltransferase [Rhodobiaceae bacterium]MCC0050074.1 peptide chain release factor N(5)-glutamine methyltransferase [Rhodobiaceae bacterium]